MPIEEQETERAKAITSLDVLVADVNRSIHNNKAIYKCELTVSNYPKTHVECTIEWLAILHDKKGRLLCKFMEYVNPIEVSLPLRIWTML